MLTFPRFAVPAAKAAPKLFASANLRRYFPGWGIPCSLAIHEVALIILLLVSVFHNPREPFRPPQREVPPRRSQVTVMMYFPPLSPGNRRAAGKAAPSGKVQPAAQAAPRVNASKTDGLVYPGPQQIVSDPPIATNRLQTISQPDLVDPPILEPAPSLPNMVLMADVAPVEPPAFQEPAVPAPIAVPVAPEEPLSSPSEPEEVKPEPPPVVTETVPLADHLAPVVPDPVLPLPPPTTAAMRLMTVPAPVVAPRKDETAVEPSSKPPEEPKIEAPPKEPEAPKQPPASQFASEPTRGADARNFLAMSPMPAVPVASIELPPGEAQARFAISPQPNLTAPTAEPPSALGDPSAAALPPRTAGVPEGGSGLPGDPPKVVTVNFGGPAGGKDGVPSTDRVGAATAGFRAGPGPAAGAGSGSGSATGPGRSPFAGITVVGQGGRTGAVAGPVVRIRTARPLQTSYGVNVVSTESSGGGLPFSGVFAGRQIHTVYLDMRQSETDSAPSWTLEFAVPRKAADQANAAPSGSQQGIELPFPAVKKPPLLPHELVLKYVREMVIVYGVINAEGKMEQMSVMKSPDTVLNDPVLEALSKWVFRPARLDGAAVAVQVLMGIPLWLPE